MNILGRVNAVTKQYQTSANIPISQFEWLGIPNDWHDSYTGKAVIWRGPAGADKKSPRRRSDPVSEYHRTMSSDSETLGSNISANECRKGKEAMDFDANCCGICLLEDGSAIRGWIDSCDHYFCFVCIMEWAKVESRCPMCKRRFSTIHRPPKPGVFPSERIVNVPVRDQVRVFVFVFFFLWLFVSLMNCIWILCYRHLIQPELLIQFRWLIHLEFAVFVFLV